MTEPAHTEEGSAILAAPPATNGAGGKHRLTIDDFRPAEPRLARTEVEVKPFGWVTLREISMSEMRSILRGATLADGTTDEHVFNQLLIANGVHDPQLTEEDVAHTFETWPANVILKLVNEIVQFNGMALGAVRDAVESFRPGPGT